MTPMLTDKASALTMKRCRLTTSSYNLNQVVRCTNRKVELFSVDQHKEMTYLFRPQRSNTNQVVAVSKCKVTKLFQATEMQAGICELHHSNIEGELRS